MLRLCSAYSLLDKVQFARRLTANSSRAAPLAGRPAEKCQIFLPAELPDSESRLPANVGWPTIDFNQWPPPMIAVCNECKWRRID
jgi:hypothetical protein